MSIKEQLPVTRTSITVVTVVLLCAAGLAYSRGWFGCLRPDTDKESSKFSGDEPLDQDVKRCA